MTRSVSLETSWNFGWWHSLEFIQGVFLNNPLQNLDDLSLMFVAGLRSHTRGEQHQANSDGVANPLIKLINSRQVTRRRYGRQVNSNVGLETGVGWRYLARIRAITRDYTKFVVGTHVGTHVLLYACTIINTCLFPRRSKLEERRPFVWVFVLCILVLIQKQKIYSCILLMWLNINMPSYAKIYILRFYCFYFIL